MEIIEHYHYTKEHEWVNIVDSTATIGISDYAQETLGDITFIELPAVGDEVEQFEQFASVESVKAASDIYSPMSGKIIEVNSDLEKNPGLINRDCYEKGWIIKIEISQPEEASKLMVNEEYENYCASLD